MQTFGADNWDTGHCSMRCHLYDCCCFSSMHSHLYHLSHIAVHAHSSTQYTILARKYASRWSLALARCIGSAVTCSSSSAAASVLTCRPSFTRHASGQEHFAVAVPLLNLSTQSTQCLCSFPQHSAHLYVSCITAQVHPGLSQPEFPTLFHCSCLPS